MTFTRPCGAPGLGPFTPELLNSHWTDCRVCHLHWGGVITMCGTDLGAHSGGSYCNPQVRRFILGPQPGATQLSQHWLLSQCYLVLVPGHGAGRAQILTIFLGILWFWSRQRKVWEEQGHVYGKPSRFPSMLAISRWKPSLNLCGLFLLWILEERRRRLGITSAVLPSPPELDFSYRDIFWPKILKVLPWNLIVPRWSTDRGRDDVESGDDAIRLCKSNCRNQKGKWSLNNF